MKVFKEKGEIVIDGEGDLTIKKSPFLEEGFISAFGIKLSEELVSSGDKSSIINFHHYQLNPGLLEKLRTLCYAMKYIWGR